MTCLAPARAASVAGPLGAGHVDRPTLTPKRPRHDVRGALCGTTARSWIHDQMSVQHDDRETYKSPAPGGGAGVPAGGLPMTAQLLRQILLFPIDGEIDGTAPAQHPAGPAA